MSRALAPLLVLAVSALASASAQPTRFAPEALPVLRYHLPGTVGAPPLDVRPALAGAQTSTAYRTSMVTVVGTLGATLGGASTLLVVVMASSPGLGSESDAVVPEGGLGVLAVAGAAVGAGLFVHVIGQDEDEYRGLIPYPDIRREDGWPAFLGAVAGALPGIGAALLLQQVIPDGDDPFLTYLAVPIAQGLGAAIAVNLSR